MTAPKIPGRTQAEFDRDLKKSRKEVARLTKIFQEDDGKARLKEPPDIRGCIALAIDVAMVLYLMVMAVVMAILLWSRL